MRRVLCLGYSVTELSGYVERLGDLAAEDVNPLTFVRSGWGGHSLNAVAYMIDEILDHAACDFVLLELFSGSVRYLPRHEIVPLFDEVLVATARRGLPVAFLNLYQGGVDYRADFVTRLMRRYADAYDIPTLDLAVLVDGLSDANKAHLLRDNVHTTPAGGRLYGDLVYAFLRHLPVSLAYLAPFRDRERVFSALPVPAMAPDRARFTLTRNGTPLTFAEIAEGETLSLDLGEPRFVQGAMLTYGPRSGTLAFGDPRTGRSRDRLPYDGFCYYTRSGVLHLRMPRVRHLTIAQRPGQPSVPLHKGEVDHGARLGRVSHIVCRRPPRMQDHLRRFASEAWTALSRPR